ncbi:hypothetical protein [Thioclava pacifica]|uniref:Lysozyme inhibitor LprI N-terminal domain-containing protein n=1 Tax=Thioclava pacifica DSM 10166 TaxID=1353537 RepID=A0A074JHI4_9RHOB|nr:hypothetical protein [Thioclava pacifica]KEO55954.1 hypothetical protein TP2_00105 [Thioclava pacifica DSM 10166]
MRRLILAVVVTALPIAAQAQPLSQSMAQCSGLFHAVSTFMSDPVRAQTLDEAGIAWRAAAVLQAQEEGQADPAGHVARYQRESYDDWRGRGKLAAFSEDFRDWTKYCSSLAKSKGLRITPD